MNYRMGTYDGGGGGNQRFQLTGGNEIGGANIVWGLQLNNQDPIYGFQRRDFDSTNDNPDPTLRYGSRIALHNTPRTYIDPGADNCAALGALFNGSVQYDNRANRGNFCRPEGQRSQHRQSAADRIGVPPGQPGHQFAHVRGCAFADRS